MTDTLFPRSDALLPWLAGETLFSLCSRHHRLWGRGTSAHSTQIMFGRPRLGTQHDFPGGLDEFALRTGQQLGSADVIARHRTLLRFYRPFLSPEAVAGAVASMRGPSVAHLKFQMGILTSRFRANHTLKACQACMQADLSDEGWVYWHLVHQYPGVWMCSKHGQALLASTVKSTGVERFLWSLPADDQLVEAGVGLDDGSRTSHLRLTKLVEALVGRTAADGWLSPDATRDALRSRFRARGWLTPGGSVRLTGAAEDYLRHCTALRGPEELNSLPTSLDESRAQLGRILRPARSGIHPLRLLVAIDWLFSESGEFLAELEAVKQEGDGESADDEGKIGAAYRHDARQEQAVQRLRDGASAASAAIELGVDVATVMAWAALAGVQASRRPKILKSPVRRQVVNSLRRGADKSEVAGKFGVSVVTITRLLRTEVGLHAAWTAARFKAAQRRARKTWERLCAGHVACGVKLLRALEPAAYAWLYRNDRAWLVDKAPGRAAPASADRRSTVRWDERDRQLSARVQQAAEFLARASGGRQLQLWQVCQEVTELKPKLRVLDRLPLTARALHDAVGARRRRDEEARLRLE
jgi:transposase